MKRLVVLLFGVVMATSSGSVFGVSPSNVAISAIQTESATSASEEYITVHNSGAVAVDVTGWRLQYFSATAVNFTSATRTITLSGLLAPNADMTVSSTGYNTQNSTIFFNATLSATGGHVRLVSGASPNEIEHDVVGWGTALHPEQVAADVVARGTAYKRAVVNGMPVDTDNNKTDFSTPVQSPPAQPIAANPSSTPQVTNVGTYEGLIITELFPDPAAPLTDANDEFIELYNDTATIINMIGLTLQTGNANNYSYTLSGTIAPHSYLVLYASQTKLTLSNSAGRAQIIDGNGTIIDETAAYGTAPTGSSWQLYNNEWSWTTNPTPTIANLVPPAGTVTTPKVKAATTTKSATKAKTASASTPKQTTQKAQTAASTNQNAAADQQSPVNKSVLIGVGILALGYVLYEYRYDITQKYRQLRSHKETR